MNIADLLAALPEDDAQELAHRELIVGDEDVAHALRIPGGDVIWQPRTWLKRGTGLSQPYRP